jgi:hypothetical protein
MHFLEIANGFFENAGTNCHDVGGDGQQSQLAAAASKLVHMH